MLGLVGIPDAAQPARLLPARVLRRHAPAHDDRHGADQLAEAAHRRRADDRARRDRAGADPRADRAAPAGDRRPRSSSSRHDLGVVAEITHDIAVMYAGRVVERAPTTTCSPRPQHPYTWGLLRSIPRPGHAARRAAHPDRGPPAVADQPAPGLRRSIPAARSCASAQARRAQARAGRRRPRPRGRLPARCDTRSELWRGWPPATLRQHARGRRPGGETPQNERQHRRGSATSVREFPITGSEALRGGASWAPASARRGRHLASTSSAARRSASWARAAAASRPPRDWCSGCSSRRRARSGSTARRSRRSPARSSRCARDADDLPGPVLVAEPAADGRHDPPSRSPSTGCTRARATASARCRT